MRQRTAKRRVATFEPMERRLCLASSVGWDGPGRGVASLTYYIGNAPASLTQAAVDAAVKSALNVWAAVADISFTRTSRPNRANSIDISFRTLDGPGRTLAEGYSPDDVNPARIAGDIQFDAAEVWEVGDALGGAAMDLVLTAAHEIGHALGLDHSDVVGSLMAPTISADGQFTGLARTDADAILALYAPAGSSSTPTTPVSIQSTPTSTLSNPEKTPVDPPSPRLNRFPKRRRRWFPRPRMRMNLIEARGDAPAPEWPVIGGSPRSAPA